MSPPTVTCPICSRKVPERDINKHLDSNCSDDPTPPAQPKTKQPVAPIFSQPSAASSSRGAPSGSTSKKRPAASSAGAGPSKRPKGSGKLSAAAPLAERLRPQSLNEFVGQPHLTGPNSLLMNLVRSGSFGSLILWGPPGCGKTTLSRLLARAVDATFKELSATDSGIADVRSVAEEAKGLMNLTGRRTILFLDEVHRFNRAQQDIFLPYIEQGIIQLIGATTENPSFKLTGALLSRCRVLVLERLTDDDIRQILTQALRRVSSTSPSDHAGVAHGPAPPVAEPIDLASSPATSPMLLPSSSQDPLSQSTTPTQHDEDEPVAEKRAAPLFPFFPALTQRVLDTIVSLCSGDARTALSLLELFLTAPQTSDDELLATLRRSVSTSYDRTGDDRYDLISALHKSVRGSEPDAALYWLARMLTAGEDPMYIARRMVVCASEDIGLADNHALPLAMAALTACQTIGMPECRIHLAHLVTYLALAPKSTRSYAAYNRAEATAKATPTAPVPNMMRNAPTKLMGDLGYSKGYAYNPDYAHPVTNEYLPSQVARERFLRDEGDLEGKTWNDDMLHRWETRKNDRKPWEGRKTVPHTENPDYERERT
ncbi:P-loop containing nucleoside triphosphate hydrolase protein [Phanerochaete sordida]|uniref:P-loop containing nucleoside triphosphate hydrolase protein n=1 Tax=Phanerochaete sordida TaxID=48140 RepID=A0A9P3LIR2_9APHY|nr:P-loop containing nucleoside triphosphate hydrolase protein [Phanerochaete sordida]